MVSVQEEEERQRNKQSIQCQKDSVSIKREDSQQHTHTHTVWPEGSSQRGEDGVWRNIIWLLEGPVIRGKGPRQSDLTQGRHKVGAPEEEEDIVELEQDEVFVVEGLPTVKRKQALSIRTLSRDVGGVECLEKEALNKYLIMTWFHHRLSIWPFSWPFWNSSSSVWFNWTAYLGVTGLPCVWALRGVKYFVYLLIRGGQEASQVCQGGNKERVSTRYLFT